MHSDVFLCKTEILFNIYFTTSLSFRAGQAYLRFSWCTCRINVSNFLFFFFGTRMLLEALLLVTGCVLPMLIDNIFKLEHYLGPDWKDKSKQSAREPERLCCNWNLPNEIKQKATICHWRDETPCFFLFSLPLFSLWASLPPFCGEPPLIYWPTSSQRISNCFCFFSALLHGPFWKKKKNLSFFSFFLPIASLWQTAILWNTIKRGFEDVEAEPQHRLHNVPWFSGVGV